MTLDKRTDLRAAEAEQGSALQSQEELPDFGEVHEPLDGRLSEGELWWRDHHEWFKARGYLLRARYSPSWVPSWENTKKWHWDCEDGRGLLWRNINDATRMSDGKYVALKRIKKSEHRYEVDIGLYFSSDEMVSEPANHCAPFYEVLTVDDDDDGTVVIVMPLLRSYNDPYLDTIGEAVDFFRQIFEVSGNDIEAQGRSDHSVGQGLQFMHRHYIAHRFCLTWSIMVDANGLCPKSCRPSPTLPGSTCSKFTKHYTRTQRPPKYYLTCFGRSRYYDPPDINPCHHPIWEKDGKLNGHRNPFQTDIYDIGNLVMEDFIQTKSGFGFMLRLVSDMVHPEPSKRPTIDEVVSRFDEIRRGLSSWELRSRIIDERDLDVFERGTRIVTHWIRRIGYVVRRVPPLPSPPS
ncbi:hypothetical protein F5I97DRAFT_785413 [Phlebopus sp. FC_14]|nr:hypothetical protein F5I97DRAFT_785413 [Phlebopus sp. FC_14]